jgi:hypothetical protein
LQTTKIDNEVKALLMDGEEVLLGATQARIMPGGSIFTPNFLYVTNKRVIFKDPKTWGLKADIIDINYQDIMYVRLKRGVFSTQIFLRSRFVAEEVTIPAVNKEIAKEVNTLIQMGIRGDLPKQEAEEISNPLDKIINPMEKEQEEEEPAYLVNLRQKIDEMEKEIQILKSSKPDQPLEPNTENARVCPNCNTQLFKYAKFCTKCGNRMEDNPEPELCDNCNALRNSSENFCYNCGKKFDPDQPDKSTSK